MRKFGSPHLLYSTYNVEFHERILRAILFPNRPPPPPPPSSIGSRFPPRRKKKKKKSKKITRSSRRGSTWSAAVATVESLSAVRRATTLLAVRSSSSLSSVRRFRVVGRRRFVVFPSSREIYSRLRGRAAVSSVPFSDRRSLIVFYVRVSLFAAFWRVFLFYLSVRFRGFLLVRRRCDPLTTHAIAAATRQRRVSLGRWPTSFCEYSARNIWKSGTVSRWTLSLRYVLVYSFQVGGKTNQNRVE